MITIPADKLCYWFCSDRNKWFGLQQATADLGINETKAICLESKRANVQNKSCEMNNAIAFVKDTGSF